MLNKIIFNKYNFHGIESQLLKVHGVTVLSFNDDVSCSL